MSELNLTPEDIRDLYPEMFRAGNGPKGGTTSGLLKALKTEAVESAPRPLTDCDGLMSEDLPPHLIIRARAGTGKTTTLVEGLKCVRGIPSALTPSDQQATVWEYMSLGREQARTVCFVAFNKSIATELQRRVPAGCDASTLHSLGFKSVLRSFPGMKVNEYIVADIISSILGQDIRDLRREKPAVLQATEKLVSLCKMNLILTEFESEQERLAVWARLDELASHYEVELTSEPKQRFGRVSGGPVTSYRDEVFALVPQVLERCLDPRSNGGINFDDMVWLPVRLGLQVYQYDMLLIDEAQDLNRCQQALSRRAGKRLIYCGDDRQAIYGFAGADSESLPRLEQELVSTDRGCVIIPLTVTRRCGRAIVAEARKLVPDFEAHESNSEGYISEARYPVQYGSDGKTPREVPYDQTYMPLVQDGDMVLCRVNAPLVSQCFRFLKRGRRATIQGRDIGKGLISTVEKLKATDVPDLVGKITDWASKESAKEQAKRNPNEAKLISIQDRADCLICFTDGAETVAAVVAKINSVFTDDKDAKGIRLSSIHKGKGLESHRVFFLMPKGATCPHPMARSAWQQEQEMNCLYIGITRAIDELIYVR